MIYHYPYSADELAGMSLPQRPQAWRRHWTVLSLLCGVAGAVLAFLSVGPIAVVVGGIGIAAGGLAVLRAGRVVAITGAVLSSLAVAVSLLMAIADLPGVRDTAAGPSAPTVSTDVDQVLADEVDVRFGKITTDSVFPELRVRVTNKLDVVRQCDIEVGAFAAPGEQISAGRVAQKSSGYGGMVLDAHATVAARAEFLLGGDDTAKNQLNRAAFRVITAACGPFDYSGI